VDEFARLNLIGKSPPFLAALALIGKFAACDATVLIQGETGTGKELAARAIHYLSPRRDLPFVPVNCGALPDNLVESELFGHVRGAFTDAREASAGLVAQARGGTLLLDEIEAMCPRAQVALLRFLQSKEYRPVGGGQLREADIRVIASSNVDLRAMVKQGSFRSDLLFRLNVLCVRLPPLRSREGDVSLLAEAFLHRLCLDYGWPAKTLHRGSLFALDRYEWPGNVRELENVIHRELLLTPGPVIEIKAIEPDDPPQQDAGASTATFKMAKARAVAEFERAYVAALLTRTGGNMTLASRIAGKDRSDLTKLLKKYGLERKGFLPAGGTGYSSTHLSA
jgi:DNA-binding NtrC family response regulator